MFYFDILKTFYDEKIKYLIVGGLSVNLHGIPRVTQDIDIIISLDPENITDVIRIMKKLGYLPKLPVNPEDLTDIKIRNSWIKEKNLIAFTFYHPSEHYKVVDIIISHPLDFNSAYANRLEKNVKDFKISLISVDDLITMKKYSGRSQDLSDIELLNKLHNFMEGNNG